METENKDGEETESKEVIETVKRWGKTGTRFKI